MGVEDYAMENGTGVLDWSRLEPYAELAWGEHAGCVSQDPGVPGETSSTAMLRVGDKTKEPGCRVFIVLVYWHLHIWFEGAHAFRDHFSALIIFIRLRAWMTSCSGV